MLTKIFDYETRFEEITSSIIYLFFIIIIMWNLIKNSLQVYDIYN